MLVLHFGSIYVLRCPFFAQRTWIWLGFRILALLFFSVVSSPFVVVLRKTLTLRLALFNC
jgi:hypothetical protein